MKQKQQTTQQPTTKIILGSKKFPVRFSYAHVFEPNAMNEGDDPKFSVSILIDKNDKDTLDKIETAIEAAKKAGAAKLQGKNGKLVAKLKLPLRDGDEERPDDEVYEGNYFLNASSSNKPGIVDVELNAIMSKDEFYSGCYGRASVNFYAFDFNGTKGIAVGLNNLQKLEEGERLSGVSSAESDFGDDSDIF